MNAFLCMILPSFVGLNLYYILTKEKNYFSLGLMYSSLCLFSNFLAMLLGIILFKDLKGNILEYLSNDFIKSLEYMAVVTVMNVLLAIVFGAIKKSVVLEIKTDEKNKKNKN